MSAYELFAMLIKTTPHIQRNHHPHESYTGNFPEKIISSCLFTFLLKPTIFRKTFNTKQTLRFDFVLRFNLLNFNNFEIIPIKFIIFDWLKS